MTKEKSLSHYSIFCGHSMSCERGIFIIRWGRWVAGREFLTALLKSIEVSRSVCSALRRMEQEVIRKGDEERNRDGRGMATTPMC